MIRVLPSLSAVSADAFRRAYGRFITLLALALFPLLPLALFGPFIAQAFILAAEGVETSEELAAAISPWVAALALLGLLFSIVVSIAAAAGMFVALSSRNDPGPRAAFRDGARVWLAVTWTHILAALAVALVALPGILLSWWSGMLVQDALATNLVLRSALFLVSLLLVVPAFAVAAWYAFAVIPAARGQVFGSAALTVSHRLVHGATGQVFGLLFAWSLFELLLWFLLALLFPGLALFQGVVYYLATSILGAAFLVTVYEALRRG